MKRGEVVFVGLSGGVDSSVAALRLKQQGYDVVGVFIKVWHPDFLVCNWEAERLDAMRVAARLDIPFLTCDAENAYKKYVADYFIDEYKAGRTPNPDVMCNSAVKFGAFYDFAKKHGADKIATGHYAQIKLSDGGPILQQGYDTQKDQSYFLWNITQGLLSQILFPVGDAPKAQIRTEAKRAGLLTAGKKDSQGVCFLGHIDIPEFLSHFVELTPGNVKDEDGQVIGTHQGALVYTIGQRHGFVLDTSNTDGKAQYVIAKDTKQNELIVSPNAPKLASRSKELIITKVNEFQSLIPGKTYSAQMRYRGLKQPVTLKNKTGTTLTLINESVIDQPAIGQSCVLYLQNDLVAGGIIET